MVMASRWAFITSMPAVTSSSWKQELPEGPAPEDCEGAVLAYFDTLYETAEALDDEFHEAFGVEVDTFCRAKMPVELGLDEESLPFTLHRTTGLEVRRGPLPLEVQVGEGRASFPPPRLHPCPGTSSSSQTS